jgi:hypothetical protein
MVNKDDAVLTHVTAGSGCELVQGGEANSPAVVCVICPFPFLWGP